MQSVLPIVLSQFMQTQFAPMLLYKWIYIALQHQILVF